MIGLQQPFLAGKRIGFVAIDLEELIAHLLEVPPSDERQELGMVVIADNVAVVPASRTRSAIAVAGNVPPRHLRDARIREQHPNVEITERPNASFHLVDVPRLDLGVTIKLVPGDTIRLPVLKR